MEKRWQKNITVTKEQAEYIKTHHGGVSISEISKMLGLTPNKTHNNMRLLGLVSARKNTGKIVKMNGYFDDEEFFKKYKY